MAKTFGLDTTNLPYAGSRSGNWGKRFDDIKMPEHIDWDSVRCPDDLRFVLTVQLRDAIRMRSYFSNLYPAKFFIDNLIDGWWNNHRRQMKMFADREGWINDYLCFVYSDEVPAPVNINFVHCDFDHMVYCYYDYAHSYSFDGSYHPYRDYRFDFAGTYVGIFVDFVRSIMDALSCCVAADIERDNPDFTKYLLLDRCTAYKNQYDSMCFTEIDGNRRPKIMNLFQDKFAFRIGTLAKDIYNMFAITKDGDTYHYVQNNRVFMNFRELYSYVTHMFESSSENYSVMYYEFMKYLGFFQTMNNNLTGPCSDTVLNKLIEYYFGVLYALRAAKLSEDIVNGKTVSDDDRVIISGFNNAVNYYKSVDKFTSAVDFKHREEGTEGFTMRSYGSYEQFKARLMDYIKGGAEHFTLFIGFHPIDFLMISLGYNWASCHNYYTNRSDYPMPFEYSHGNWNGGGYSGGDFNYMASNCIVVYTAHDYLKPLYFQAKSKRCLLWIGNNLDSIRMNFWYPCFQAGHPMLSTTEKNMSKSVRNLVQDFASNYNGTSGSNDWKVKYMPHTNYEDYDDVFNASLDYGHYMGYPDPISLISYVKYPEDSGHTPGDIVFSGYVSYFDYDESAESIDYGMLYYEGDDSDHVMHPDIGVAFDENNEQIRTDLNVCLPIHGNYYTLEWYNKYRTSLTTAPDGTVNSANIISYTTPNGVSYCIDTELPGDVHKCSACGEYFSDDLMYNGMCVPCFIRSTGMNADTAIDMFSKGLISISFASAFARDLFFEKLSAVHSDFVFSNGLAVGSYTPSMIFNCFYYKLNKIFATTGVTSVPRYSVTEEIFGGND